MTLCDPAHVQIWSPGGCPATTGKFTLAGLRGMHFHENPPPPARCYPTPHYSGHVFERLPEPIPCTSSPGDSCPDHFGCGYYAQFEPNLKRATSMQKPAIWVQIFGLGSTLICQEENVPWGFRAEQYRALRLFWPRDDFGALLPGEAQISDWYPRLRFANRERKQTIRECLEILSDGLAMELTQDVIESWQGWGGWEYLV